MVGGAGATWVVRGKHVFSPQARARHWLSRPDPAATEPRPTTGLLRRSVRAAPVFFFFFFKFWEKHERKLGRRVMILCCYWWINENHPWGIIGKCQILFLEWWLGLWLWNLLIEAKVRYGDADGCNGALVVMMFIIFHLRVLTQCKCFSICRRVQSYPHQGQASTETKERGGKLFCKWKTCLRDKS